MAVTVYKPPGLPVLPPHGAPDGDCVLRRLLAAEPNRGAHDWPAGFAGGVAHRLDVSTSGAVWVADDVGELERMRALFAAGALTKTYRLRAARDPGWNDNRCERPIAHARRHKGRMVVQRSDRTPHRGKWYPARTAFRRIEGTLFEATITTGVMHQIRVHAAFVGIPLLGDGRYGGGATPEHAPAGVTFFLHHIGLTDGRGWGTEPVELPPWAQPKS